MLIGITGKIGSGKTTASNYIVNHWSFQDYTMADPIKKIAKIFGFNDTQLYGTQSQKLEIHPHWGISAREFLQKIGTDIFRKELPKTIPNINIERSVWCDIFKINFDKNSCIIVSDIRFLDEASLIKELGGYLFRIERPCELPENDSCHNHISETQMNDINVDFTINNNGTVQELYEKIDKIMLDIGVF